MVLSVWYVPYSLKKLRILRMTWLWHGLSALILGGYMLLLYKGIYTWGNTFIAATYNVLGLLFVFSFICFSFGYRPSAEMPGKTPFSAHGGRERNFAVRAAGHFRIRQCPIFHGHALRSACERLMQPVKIAHVPDIHLGTQRGKGYLKKILQVIDEKKPDIVLYNGDLVDSNIALKEDLFSLFKRVQAEQIFTTGNHEYYMDTDRALQLIADAGIRIVRSEMLETHGLQLIGMEYMNADRETYDAHVVNALTIQEELPKIARDSKKPTVLVHHSPVGMRYAAEGNIDVMLASHTHAGQFFPGTALVKLSFHMDKGLHKSEKRHCLFLKEPEHLALDAPEHSQ